jgi:hypothetical protein
MKDILVECNLETVAEGFPVEIVELNCRGIALLIHYQLIDEISPVKINT